MDRVWNHVLCLALLCFQTAQTVETRTSPGLDQTGTSVCINKDSSEREPCDCLQNKTQAYVVVTRKILKRLLFQDLFQFLFVCVYRWKSAETRCWRRRRSAFRAPLAVTAMRRSGSFTTCWERLQRSANCHPKTTCSCSKRWSSRLWLARWINWLAIENVCHQSPWLIKSNIAIVQWYSLRMIRTFSDIGVLSIYWLQIHLQVWLLSGMYLSSFTQFLVDKI